MGQYHAAYNATKNTGYPETATGEPGKLTEKTATYAGQLAIFTMLKGPWNGDKILYVGNNQKNLVEGVNKKGFTLYYIINGIGKIEPQEIGYKNAQSQLRARLTKMQLTTKGTRNHLEFAPLSEANLDNETPLVFWNSDKNQHLTPSTFGDTPTELGLLSSANLHESTSIEPGATPQGNTIAALMILLAVSQHNAGGDFWWDRNGEYADLPGSWGGDHIHVIPASELAEDSVDVSEGMRALFARTGEVSYLVGTNGDVIRFDPANRVYLTTQQIEEAKNFPLADNVREFYATSKQGAMSSREPAQQTRLILSDEDVLSLSKRMIDDVVDSGFECFQNVELVAQGETPKRDINYLENRVVMHEFSLSYLKRRKFRIASTVKRNEGYIFPFWLRPSDVEAYSLARIRELLESIVAMELCHAAYYQAKQAFLSVMPELFSPDLGGSQRFYLPDAVLSLPVGFSLVK